MKKTIRLRKIFFAMAITGLCIKPLLAQPGVSPYYKAPPSYAGKTVVVPAGTTFEGRIQSTIGSSISKQGTPFVINISSPILANGSDVLIPAGAEVLGEVVQAIPAKDVPHAKKEKPVGKLRVQINALKMPDGMTYPMVASLTGEETIRNPQNMYNQFGGGNNSNPVRGSGVGYLGSPTGFQSVAPGTAHYDPRTGMSQVVTKNEMLNDPIYGREHGMNEKMAMRSLVKKNRNLFIYNGSPLTIRLEAPFKLGISSSGGEESALRIHPTELRSPPSSNYNVPYNVPTNVPTNAPTNNPYQNPAQSSSQNPYQSPSSTGAGAPTPSMPSAPPRINNQESNF